MKHLLLLYNVQAGHARIAKHLDAIEDIFARAGYAPEAKLIRFGQNPFDPEADYDLVVVCGGDGTINYVVNAMMSLGKSFPLGIIPAGTANDFAGAIGMSSNTRRAAQQIVDGEIRQIDCGKVNDIHFINVFSFGLFTTTSQHTPDKVKHIMGRSAYLIEGSKELHNREFIPIHVKHDGGEFDARSLMVLCFNGETAGRFRLARKASVCDGLFDLLLLEKQRTFLHEAFACLLFLITGRPNYAIRHIRSAHIEMSSPLSPLTDVDGQHGADFPLTVDCLAGVLRIVCPKR